LLHSSRIWPIGFEDLFDRPFPREDCIQPSESTQLELAAIDDATAGPPLKLCEIACDPVQHADLDSVHSGRYRASTPLERASIAPEREDQMKLLRPASPPHCVAENIGIEQDYHWHTRGHGRLWRWGWMLTAILLPCAIVFTLARGFAQKVGFTTALL
jgi:hypothetical protein